MLAVPTKIAQGVALAPRREAMASCCGGAAGSGIIGMFVATFKVQLPHDGSPALSMR